MKLVDLETAKALQELGYDGEYSAWIDPVDASIEHNSSFILDWYIPCPRLDDAAYWLREKYGLYVYVRYDKDEVDNTNYDTYIAYIKIERAGYVASSATYEEALERGVKRVLKIIKDSQSDE